MDVFPGDRAEILAAWDELRERARDEGEAAALSPVFRETLDRHGALMRPAASFKAWPQVFECLLAQRAGVGAGELEELRKVHARVGTYLRSIKARTAHTAPHEEPAIVEAIAAVRAQRRGSRQSLVQRVRVAGDSAEPPSIDDIPCLRE